VTSTCSSDLTFAEGDIVKVLEEEFKGFIGLVISSGAYNTSSGKVVLRRISHAHKDALFRGGEEAQQQPSVLTELGMEHLLTEVFDEFQNGDVVIPLKEALDGADSSRCDVLTMSMVMAKLFEKGKRLEGRLAIQWQNLLQRMSEDDTSKVQQCVKQRALEMLQKHHGGRGHVGFELFQRHDKGCGKGFLLPVSDLDRLVGSDFYRGHRGGENLFYEKKYDSVRHMFPEPVHPGISNMNAECRKHLAEMWDNESEFALFFQIFIFSCPPPD
jgi:hypothetical protein